MKLILILIISIFCASSNANTLDIKNTSINSPKFLKLIDEIITSIKDNNVEKTQSNLIEIFKYDYPTKDQDLIKHVTYSSIKIISENYNCNNNKFLIDLLSTNKSTVNKNRKDLYTLLIVDQIIDTALLTIKDKNPCFNNIYELTLQSAYKNIIENRKNNIFITSEIIKKLHSVVSNDQSNDNKFHVYYYSFISKLLKNKDKKINEIGLEYFKELKIFHDDYINEMVIVDNEHFFLDINNNISDHQYMLKIAETTKYIKQDFWPFNASRKKYFESLLNRKFKDKYIGKFFLIATLEPLLKNLLEKDPKLASATYKKIISINIDELTSNISAIQKTSDGEPLEIMLAGFKLKAALSMNDINTADKLFNLYFPKIETVYVKNLDNLADYYKKFGQENFDNLLYPFFSYSIFMKDKINSKKIITIINKNSKFDITKIKDEDYLKQNEPIFKNKINTYLLMHEEYAKLIGEDSSIFKDLTYRFSPESYRDIYNVLYELSYNLAGYNIENAKFYLKLFKEDLNNYQQSKSFYLMKEFYNSIALAIELYPGESSLDSQKKIWFDTFYSDYLDIYALVYFHDFSTSFYTNKISDSYNLFKYNLQRGRREEAYYFSIEYLNNISTGFTNIGKNNEVSSKFKDSISNEINTIIDFYLSNDKLNDATNAISIYKLQQFYDSIQRSGSSHIATYNDRNLLIKSNINKKLAEIEFINSQKNSLDDLQSKNKIESLKLSLKSDLIKFYASNKDPIQNKFLTINANKDLSIANDSIFIDYFIVRDKVSIIISKNNGNKTITLELPNNFNEKVINLIKFYNNPESSNLEIKIANKSIYDILIKPIEEHLLSNDINIFYVRTNSLLSIIPFRNILLSNNDFKKDINVVYSGINATNLSLNHKIETSSLFATDLKFPNYSALKFAKKEVDLIKKSFDKKFSKNNSNIYMNKDFNINNLSKQFTSKSNLIHIASHYSYTNNGSLLFGNGESISSADLWKKLPKTINTKLVTISACESGLIFDAGNFTDNLPNVFIDKGVNIILASTWKISDDATAYFMDIFYSILLLIDDPIIALNLTQLSFNEGNFDVLEKKYKLKINKNLENYLTKYSHPFYWSGFQIITAR